MTRFVIGFLIGVILGAAGMGAFLVVGHGSDYFVSASPRVRELEAGLREGQHEREWLRARLTEANDALGRLESRFVGLAQRFESLAGQPPLAPPRLRPQAVPSAAPPSAAQGQLRAPALAPAAPIPTPPVAASAARGIELAP